jgi:predicted nucleic acid-binding protein
VSPVLVDSNILLDISTNDPIWQPWSADQLSRLSDEAQLFVNPVIYAELSVSYASIDELDAMIAMANLKRDAIPFEAGFLAGKAFAAYRKRGGDRSSLLPDFLIGAHAAVRNYRILTRDDRRYRTYFSSVTLITPRQSH